MGHNDYYMKCYPVGKLDIALNVYFLYGVDDSSRNVPESCTLVIKLFDRLKEKHTY